MRNLGRCILFTMLSMAIGLACSHRSGPMRVVKNDGTVVVGTIVDARPDGVTVRTSTGETVVIARADIASMAPDNTSSSGSANGTGTVSTDQSVRRDSTGRDQTARTHDANGASDSTRRTDSQSSGGTATEVDRSQQTGNGSAHRTSSDASGQRTNSAGAGSNDATSRTDGSGQSRTADAEQKADKHDGTPREIVLPAGTRLSAALKSAVDSATSHPEDPVQATLTRPVTVGDTEVLPVGTEVDGVVVEAMPALPVKGRAVVIMRFDRVQTGSGAVEIRTAPVRRDATASVKHELKRAGIGAAIGGAFGAVVGHSKKALGIGAAAGAGGVEARDAFIKGGEVHMPAGTALTIRLAEPAGIMVAGR